LHFHRVIRLQTDLNGLYHCAFHELETVIATVASLTLKARTR
jgi:hypothetical protein